MRQTRNWVILTWDSYNSSIAPGWRITTEFQASATAPVTELGGFSLRGLPCLPA